MTTVKRHFLRWLLTVCAVVCLFAVPAFAEEADPVSAMTDTGTVLADDLIDMGAGLTQNLLTGSADLASSFVETVSGGMLSGDLIRMGADAASDLIGTAAGITKDLAGGAMSIPAQAAAMGSDTVSNLVPELAGTGSDLVSALAENTQTAVSGLAQAGLNGTTGLIQSVNSGLADLAAGTANDLISGLTGNSLAGSLTGGLAGTGLSLVSNLTNSALNGLNTMTQNLLGTGMNLIPGPSLLASLLAPGSGGLSDLFLLPSRFLPDGSGLASVLDNASAIPSALSELGSAGTDRITGVIRDLGGRAADSLNGAVNALASAAPSDGSALGSLLGSGIPVNMISTGASVLEQLQESARTLMENGVRAASDNAGTAGLVASDFAAELEGLLRNLPEAAGRILGEGTAGEGLLEELLDRAESAGSGVPEAILDTVQFSGAPETDRGGLLSSLLNTFAGAASAAADSGRDGLGSLWSLLTPEALPAEEEPTLSIYQNRYEAEPVNLNGVTDLFLLPGRILSAVAGAALGTLDALPDPAVNHGTGTLADTLRNAGCEGTLGRTVGFGLGTLADAFTGAVTGTLLGTPVGAGLGALTGGLIGTGFDALTGSLLGSALSAPLGAAAGSVLGGIVGTALLPGKWLGAAALGTASTLLGPAKWIDALAGAGLGALSGLPMAGILELVVRPLLILPEAITALAVSELVNVPLGTVFGPMKWILGAGSIPFSFIPSLIAGFLGQTAIFPIVGMIGVPLVQLAVWLGTGAITGILTLPVSLITVPVALVLAAPICAVAVLPLFGFFMTVATVLHVFTYVPVLREIIWTIVGGFVGVPIGALEGSLLGAVVGGVLGAAGGFLLAFPGFRIPVAILTGLGWALAAGAAWFFLGGFNGLIIGVVGGFIASLATSPLANIAVSTVISGIIAALSFGVGTLLDGGLGALLGALVQPLYYGGIRLISNLGTDVLAALSMLIPATLGILPGFLFGSVVDALSGILPGFALGSIADAVTGGMLGSAPGALIASVGGALTGLVLGSILLPGKWLGAMTGSVPGALLGGSLGNLAGRGAGILLLPGKWLGALLGGLFGDCSDTETKEGLPADCGDSSEGGREAGRVERGLPVPSHPVPARSPVSIDDLRHGGSALLPGSYSPETGDRGVTGCAAVSVLSLLALLLLMGARKKEEP